jgi:hypothetical protein
MDFKALFASLAVALSHLKASAENTLFDDQKAKIQEAIDNLKTVEDGLDTFVAEQVKTAIADALPGMLAELKTELQTTLDGLSARIDTLGARADGVDVQLNDIGSAVKSVTAGLNAMGTDTLSGGQATDTVNAGASAAVEQPVAAVVEPVVLGPTTVATPETPSAAVHADDNPAAVVSAPDAPLAVVTSDPTIVAQVQDSHPDATAVILTDHPTDGTVLVTPVLSPVDPAAAPAVVVDASTGVPAAAEPTGTGD